MLIRRDKGKRTAAVEQKERSFDRYGQGDIPLDPPGIAGAKRLSALLLGLVVANPSSRDQLCLLDSLARDLPACPTQAE
jgi:hypothetical protein